MPHRTTIRWISSPVDTVFTHLHNLRTYFEQTPQIRVVDWSPAEPAEQLAIGAMGLLRAGRRELQLRISRYAENRFLELEVTTGRSVTYERLELEAAMGGTRIIHTTETRSFVGSEGRQRLAPTQRAIDHMLGLIKDALEATDRSLRAAIILPDERLIKPAI